MNAISLPYPVSTNRLTRFGYGRAYLSPRARAWKAECAAIAIIAGIEVSTMPMHVSIILHPKLTKAGLSSKTRCDIDNSLKAAFDALNGIAWADDKQIEKVTAQIGEPLKDGGLTVSWVEV